MWGLFKQNVSVNQIIKSSYVLCWGAKWYGKQGSFFSSLHIATRKSMLKAIHKLMSEADAIVHYNGDKFDIKVLNTEFVLVGLSPPSPSKQIDLYKTVKNRFRFPSSKLEYVVKALGLGEKYKTEGHTLWVKCMAGDTKAWVDMEKYNKQDVVLLENLYDKLQPWIKNHPNHNLYDGDGTTVLCPNCGASSFQRRGFSFSSVGKYRRYVCKLCGTWFKNTKGIIPQTTERYTCE